MENIISNLKIKTEEKIKGHQIEDSKNTEGFLSPSLSFLFYFFHLPPNEWFFCFNLTSISQFLKHLAMRI